MTTVVADTRDHRAALFKTFQFVEAFRELFPDVPMQTISVFLIIAMKPGITQRDLLKLSDISQAGVSRNVMALGDVNRHGKPGLGVVQQRSDPLDRRQITLHLTPAGNELANRVLSIIGHAL